MFKPSFEEFCRLCERGNLVPVYDEQLADMETPVSVLNRFSGRNQLFLLESVSGGGERFGRYSFLGLAPYAVFTIENGRPFLERNGVKNELPLPPEGAFFALREQMRDLRPAVPEGLPPLSGGAIGYLSYETVNQFERLPEPKAPLAVPEAAFLLTDEVIIFDNVRHTVLTVVNVRPGDYPTRREAYDCAVRKIQELNRELAQPAPAAPAPRQAAKHPRLESNQTREEFCDMVDAAKEHIREGDIIQVVLSQKFSCKTDLNRIQLYRALRLINPSPYTFFFKNGTHTLIGSSPETLVKLDHGCATVRPIAGTRKRGATQEQDMALADELLQDTKERAEHLMLLDLGRNDLGRVAVPGSVQVREFMNVERYSHVMHLTSDVESVLASGRDGFDLVKAVFPAGTLSGAPKVRAMELIHELEPEPRGVYGGAVGYLSYDGNLDLAITIRTLELQNDRLTVQAGAGIVFDSDPEKEYEETVNKAQAVFKAIELAARNLEL